MIIRLNGGKITIFIRFYARKWIKKCKKRPRWGWSSAAESLAARLRKHLPGECPCVFSCPDKAVPGASAERPLAEGGWLKKRKAAKKGKKTRQGEGGRKAGGRARDGRRGAHPWPSAPQEMPLRVSKDRPLQGQKPPFAWPKAAFRGAVGRRAGSCRRSPAFSGTKKEGRVRSSCHAKIHNRGGDSKPVAKNLESLLDVRKGHAAVGNGQSRADFL